MSLETVLVECGFISNKAEANKLNTDSHQNSIASIIDLLGNENVKKHN